MEVSPVRVRFTPAPDRKFSPVRMTFSNGPVFCPVDGFIAITRGAGFWIVKVPPQVPDSPSGFVIDTL
jgi:hypothetical protein